MSSGQELTFVVENWYRTGQNVGMEPQIFLIPRSFVARDQKLSRFHPNIFSRYGNNHYDEFVLNEILE